MTIGFIARGLTNGGVTRYIESVLTEFNERYSEGADFVVFTDRADFCEKYKNLHIVYIKNGNKLWWDYFKIVHYLRGYKVDCMFYPKNVIPFTHCFFSFKKINIIHDLAYFDRVLKEYRFFDTIYMKAFMGFSCRLADKIVAVSHATKTDIVHVFKIPDEKISVVYEGVSSEFESKDSGLEMQRILEKYKIQQPFIFYSGSLSPRKNILRALKAFQVVQYQIPHNFYLAGGQSWHDEEVTAYIKEHLSNRVFRIGFVEEADLPFLYSAASLYLYPSLYEGFGLPILEAQACGCPVLTSNASSCPEIAGKGAEIVNGKDVGSIRDGMMRVLCDDVRKKELIALGYANVNKYSWEDTARRLLDLAKERQYGALR